MRGGWLKPLRDNSETMKVKEPKLKDKGCIIYPTCLGNKEYDECPFAKCLFDLKPKEANKLKKALGKK